MKPGLINIQKYCCNETAFRNYMMSGNSLLDKFKLLLTDVNKQNASANAATFEQDYIPHDIGTIQYNPLHVNHTSHFVSKYSASFEDPTSEWEIVIIVLYCLIVLVSLFGNCIVCKIVFCNSAMRSTTNIFIGNLSVSDLLMTVINIPLRLTRQFSRNWPLGHFLCRCLPFFQGLSVNVSSFTMACIALDRYHVIAHPLKPRPTMISIILKLIFIWIMAAMASFPYTAIADLQENFSYVRVIRCQLVYPEPRIKVRQTLTLIIMTVQYLVPLTITVYIYSKICYIMWNRRSVGIMSERQRYLRHMTKWRTIKMLIIVLFVFAICWFPLNIYHIYQDFRGTVDYNKHKSHIELISHCFAMSSVCYNPFIYCWLNDRFQTEAKAVLSWFFRFTPTSDSSSINSRNSHLQQRNYKYYMKSNKVSIMSINTNSKYSNRSDLALLRATKSYDPKNEILEEEDCCAKLKICTSSTVNLKIKKSTESEFAPDVHEIFENEKETKV